MRSSDARTGSGFILNKSKLRGTKQSDIYGSDSRGKTGRSKPNSVLYICDAFEAMGGNGSYGANMRRLGFGMVSKDAVALDSIAFLLMNELDHENQVISPAEIAYLFMLNQKANQGNPQYGKLLQSIDEVFKYENLGTNINQETLINKMKQIGHLEAHREIKAQVEASDY